jgi:hypothetical protein
VDQLSVATLQKRVVTLQTNPISVRERKVVAERMSSAFSTLGATLVFTIATKRLPHRI